MHDVEVEDPTLPDVQSGEAVVDPDDEQGDIINAFVCRYTKDCRCKECLKRGKTEGPAILLKRAETLSHACKQALLEQKEKKQLGATRRNVINLRNLFLMSSGNSEYELRQLVINAQASI